MSNGLSGVVQTGANPKVKGKGLLANVGNTDLLSLQYPGNWRDQPFVQAPIPKPNEPLETRVTISPGFLTTLANSITGAGGSVPTEIRAVTAGDGGALSGAVRTGINFPINTVRDVTRLTKFFGTTQGILFTVNQNVLTQTSVRPTIYNTKTKPVLNDAVYLPTSTLAQAAISGLGGHLLKQGLNPFPSSDLFNTNTGNRPTYLDSFITQLTNPSPEDGPLELLYSDLFKKPSRRTEYILDYFGGPGSVLGVGKTVIDRATDRTGAPIASTIGSITANPLYTLVNSTASIVGSTYLTYDPYLPDTTILKNEILQNTAPSFWPDRIDRRYGMGRAADIITSSVATIDDSNTQVYSFDQIQQATVLTSSITPDSLIDFRKILRNSQTSQSMQLASSLDYGKWNIENRTNFGKVKTSYTAYGDAKLADSSNPEYVYDKITAMELYASAYNKNQLTNDLVQFRIEALDNDNPAQSVFMHFRAYINGVTDNYQAEWSPFKYVGRGENLYTYKGFNRTMNFSFDVAAQSKGELGAMYRKLNYLASNLAPDYSGDGYMRGPLVLVTIGGYVYSQPGFITQLTYEIPADVSWEIGITDNNSLPSNADVSAVSSFSDSSVKELPKMIKVTSFAFTPIHRFTPRKQKLTVATKATDQNSGYNQGIAIGYGQQRYIALASSLGTGSNANLYDYTQNNVINGLIQTPGTAATSSI